MNSGAAPSLTGGRAPLGSPSLLEAFALPGSEARPAWRPPLGPEAPLGPPASLEQRAFLEQAASLEPPASLGPPAPWRRNSPLLLLAVAAGRPGTPDRLAAPGRQGLPGPASAEPHLAEPDPVVCPRSTPVPTPAHTTPRAIRVHRSPR